MQDRAITCVLVLTNCVTFAVAAQSPRVPAEYRTTAKQTTILQSSLVSASGKEGTVLSVNLPAGWVGDWRYHTGDVFRVCAER